MCILGLGATHKSEWSSQLMANKHVKCKYEDLLTNRLKLALVRFQHHIRHKYYGLSESVTLDTIIDALTNFRKSENNLISIRTICLNKTIRKSNFPEYISENIAKYAYGRKYGKYPIWDLVPGDLHLKGKIFEVKAFTSNGPMSFSPKVKWDKLIIVDATNYSKYKFVVYELLHNDTFYKLEVSKNETISDKMSKGQRPRISPKTILKKLMFKIIFSGNIKRLK